VTFYNYPQIFYKSVILILILTTNVQVAKSQITDSSSLVTITRIIIEGNTKTKETIIHRELTFKKGDKLSIDKLNSEIKLSRENLLKTPLFNYVDIDSVSKAKGVDTIAVHITVEERWYIWPEVVFTYADRNFTTWLKKRDFTRVNLGAGMTKYNFRGMNEKLRFKGMLGYEKSLIFSYTNIFLDKKRRNSLAFYASGSYKEGLEYGLNENQLESVKIEGEIAEKRFKSSILYSYRKKIYDSHKVMFEYENWQVSDTVIKLNQNFLGNNISKTDYFTLEYQYEINKRDSRSYPLAGYSLDLSLKKYGLGILNNELNSFNFSARYSKFIKLSNRFYTAGSFAAAKTIGTSVPFIIQNGFGYENNLRGYEHYVINGSDFALVNSSLKFEAIKPQIVNLNFIPIKKFKKIHYAVYFDIFFDTGYVNGNNNFGVNSNSFTNKPLYGYGAGINLVAYYDAVLRLEYSTIHTGESGFFLDFKVPF